MRVYWKALVFALALGIGSVLAADTDADADEAPEQPPASTEPAANGATPEAQARPPAAPTADEGRATPARPADDRFVPTDRLRYDQEVDFPADI